MATQSSHPAALPGPTRRLYIASRAVALLSLGVVVLSCALGTHNSPVPLIVALLVLVAGVLLYGVSVLIENRSWSHTPADADSFRAPAWVPVFNELSGILTYLSLPVVMITLDDLIGLVTTLLVLAGTSGYMVARGLQSKPRERGTWLARSGASAGILVGTIWWLFHTYGEPGQLTLAMMGLLAIPFLIAAAHGAALRVPHYINTHFVKRGPASA